jgi:Protein of unknown function (DUF2971)
MPRSQRVAAHLTRCYNLLMPIDPGGRDAALIPLFLQAEWNEALSDGIAPPATLYHYTTAEGLVGIIREMKLRATNFSFLNDPTEVQYGKELAVEYLESTLNKLVQPYRDLIEQTRQALHAKVMSESYVTCFTALSDDLGQWRAYGSSAAERYCLGFDGSKLGADFSTRPGGRLAEIVYDPRLQRKLLRSIVRRSLRFVGDHRIAPEGWPDVASTIANVIASRLPEFKNPAYKYEAEWRIIRWHDGLEHDDLSFETSRRVLRPFLPVPLSHPLPLRAVQVMAPGRKETAIKAAQLLLQKAELSGIPVTHSMVPFAE